MTNFHGTRGNDLIIGSPRDDVLHGGRGDDMLIASGGHDVLKGGKGHDVFVVSDFDLIIDFKPGVDKLIVDNAFEVLYTDGLGGLYVDFYDGVLPGPNDLIATTPGYTVHSYLDILNA